VGWESGAGSRKTQRRSEEVTRKDGGERFLPTDWHGFSRRAAGLLSFAAQFSRQFIDGRGRTRFPLIEEGIDFHGWKKGELLAVGGGLGVWCRKSKNPEKK